MKPSPFDYVRAESVEHAVALLAQHGDEAKLLAGGQSLVPLLNLRLARPALVIDIARLPLQGIGIIDGQIRLGALVRHRVLEFDETIAAELPLLARAARLIGFPPIRNRGSLGGSLVHADPAAELPAVALALDAELEVVSASRTRTIAARDFFEAPFMTALDEDEMVVGIRLPRHADRRVAFEEATIRAGDFAVVGVAVIAGVEEDGTIDEARIAIAGASGAPIRAREAEAALTGNRLDDAALRDIGQMAAAATTPSDDIHASASYRRWLADRLTRRAVRHAAHRGQ